MSRTQTSHPWWRVLLIYCAVGPLLGALVVLVVQAATGPESTAVQFAQFTSLAVVFAFILGTAPALVAGAVHVLMQQVFSATRSRTQIAVCSAGLLVSVVQLFLFLNWRAVGGLFGALLGFVLPPLFSAFVLSTLLYRVVGRSTLSDPAPGVVSTRRKGEQPL